VSFLSQKKAISVIQISSLMLYRETVGRIIWKFYTVWTIMQFLNVRPGGTYNYHWALMLWRDCTVVGG
jgi:hypothetical protein